MITIFSLLAATIFLTAAPAPSFAVWDLEIVSQERAKQLGMEVGSTAAGPSHVVVNLEFKTEGKLKDFSQVDLSLGKDDNLVVTAALREDRSKPGRVVVSFTADAAQLDKLTLRVRVPFRDGGVGGTIPELQVKRFIEPKKDP